MYSLSSREVKFLIDTEYWVIFCKRFCDYNTGVTICLTNRECFYFDLKAAIDLTVLSFSRA